MYLLLLLFPTIYSFNLFMSERPPPMWSSLSSRLKGKARSWFIDRAKQEGIDWDAMVSESVNQMTRLEELKNKSTDYTIEYPEYYTQPFHGYDDGNLNWLCAHEGAAASLSMAVNYWKGVNPIATQDWLRYNITNNIKNYIKNTTLISPTDILDVGCSVGISTEFLSYAFKKSHITGIDLSPYFIAEAKLRSENFNFNIDYFHRLAENTHFDNNIFKLVTCNFIMHELPEKATINILNELNRITYPGGVIAITDLTPKELKKDGIFSVFTKWAFEVTEPHIYGYYERDMKTLLHNAGYINVEQVKNDPLNSVWLGVKQ